MKKFQKTNEKNISKIKYYMIEIQRKREKKKKILNWCGKKER